MHRPFTREPFFIGIVITFLASLSLTLLLIVVELNETCLVRTLPPSLMGQYPCVVEDRGVVVAFRTTRQACNNLKFKVEMKNLEEEFTDE